MKTHLSTLLLPMALAVYGSQAFASPSEPTGRICPLPWLSADSIANDCSLVEYTFHTRTKDFSQFWEIKSQIRSGYFPENEYVPFRGNIIYYEGLGDSMANHQPLFAALANAGYRVIAFDYLGQGGSGGSMNDTRIQQIAELGQTIWETHARDLDHFPKKNIIGWSTGGLAAYVQARTAGEERNIVLIAPGLAPRTIVGEHKPLEFKFNQITLSTLTTQVYGEGVPNPHVDPIYPRSPLDVPSFSLDFFWTAHKNKSIPMSQAVNGFVLLSSENDSYIDVEETFEIVRAQAPQFEIKQYPGALHEIDNEAEPNGSAARRDILEFLERNN